MHARLINGPARMLTSWLLAFPHSILTHQMCIHVFNGFNLKWVIKM